MISKINTKKKKLNILLFLTLFIILFIPAENSQAASEWRYEGIAYSVPYNSEETRPIYRFYSPSHKAHFFTMSPSEKDKIISTYSSNEWRYEGIAFYVPINSEGNRPVYRFYSSRYRTHFFTTSSSEKDKIIATYPETEWRYEGIAYYVPTTDSGNRPLYRFYNKVNKAHFFTTSESEKDRLLIPLLGPEISIGLWSYSKSETQDDPIRIESENYSYKIKNEQGRVYATVPNDAVTKIKYESDGNLRIYNSIDDIIVNKEVIFEAADSSKKNSIIFNVHKPESSYDKYRTKIRVRYSDTSKKIWTINELPLEQYSWGMGEITGTGPMEYNKLMTTMYKTYGYWKILHSTAYATEGFKVDATPGNQIYKGYEWEEAYPRIKQGAEATQGEIIKHDGDIALTPYSSWTDGRTRSFEERWGSKLYPWCQSVSDPYGDYNGDYWDNSYKSTSELVSGGNHMVGISAHGALTLAYDKDWDWQRIAKYYLDDISISSEY
jgi:hypothetical protein